MSLPATLSIPNEVMARQVGKEIVLLDLASGNYFGLDEVGARIWQLLSDGKTPQDLHEALLAEYEVAPEQLHADIERLLVQLTERGLIQVG